MGALGVAVMAESWLSHGCPLQQLEDVVRAGECSGQAAADEAGVHQDNAGEDAGSSFSAGCQGNSADFDFVGQSKAGRPCICGAGDSWAGATANAGCFKFQCGDFNLCTVPSLAKGRRAL